MNSPAGMIDFSSVLHNIVLYSQLHYGHFVDLKSSFVFTFYNFVCLHEIHHKRKKLEIVTLSLICGNNSLYSLIWKNNVL